jgi:hypothetical protein
MAIKAYDNLKHSIRFWLLRKLPTCQQTVQSISQSMERKLTARERINLKLHLWICAWCQWYLEHLLLIRDAARAKGLESLEPDSLSGPTLSSEARERIKRKLAGGN